MSVRQDWTRRKFLAQTAAAGVAASIGGAAANSQAQPRRRSSTEKLRLASVGVGGMGASDLGSLSSHQQVEVVALCDVDRQRLNEAAQKHPQAKLYADYREMLSEMESSIDAVNVATPDHTHAPAAMSAMNLGKPVYCQKPLTHDVYEARRLREVSEERDLVTQMGIQIHSDSAYRTAVKVIQEGAIGKVRKVYSWSDKTWGYDGPTPKPTPVPEYLAWDLWLGTAPERPFSAGHYHPGDWRRWVDFGCGTMGDMGIHILDPVFSALKLAAPKVIVSKSPAPPKDSFGLINEVQYTYGATDYTTDDFQLTWFDGRKPELAELKEVPGQGSLFVGENGMMLLPHIAMPTLMGGAKGKIEPVPGGNHYHLWVDACLGGAPTTADFTYSGPLTESLLLGVIANRFPGQQLDWDWQAMKITNHDLAQAMVHQPYRDGWKIAGLS